MADATLVPMLDRPVFRARAGARKFHLDRSCVQRLSNYADHRLRDDLLVGRVGQPYACTDCALGPAVDAVTGLARRQPADRRLVVWGSVGTPRRWRDDKPPTDEAVAKAHERARLLAELAERLGGAWADAADETSIRHAFLPVHRDWGQAVVRLFGRTDLDTDRMLRLPDGTDLTSQLVVTYATLAATMSDQTARIEAAVRLTERR